MGFLFSGIFWGVVLILLGLSVIVRIVFNIHLPVFRIIVALVLIYIGIRLLAGGWWSCRMGENRVLFGESSLSAHASRGDYDVIFGRASIDMTDSAAIEKNPKVSTVFGQSTIKIPSNIPVQVRVSATFASARTPDGTVISFGDYTYRNKACRETAPRATVTVSVVFGNCVVVEE